MDWQYLTLHTALRAPATLDYERVLALIGAWHVDGAVPYKGWHIVNYGYSSAGIILMGSHDYVGLHHIDGHPATIYNRRKPLDGTTGDRVRDAFRRALELARLLEGQSVYPGLAVDPGRWFLAANDALRVPNTDAAVADLRGPLEEILRPLFGAGAWTITRRPAGQRFGVDITVRQAPAVAELEARLGKG